MVFLGCISKPLAFESTWLLFDGSYRLKLGLFAVVFKNRAEVKWGL